MLQGNATNSDYDDYYDYDEDSDGYEYYYEDDDSDGGEFYDYDSDGIEDDESTDTGAENVRKRRPAPL